MGDRQTDDYDDELVVNTQPTDLAFRLEEHEAAVWLDCVQATSELPGDPLQVVIDRSGSQPLVALRAVDGSDLNRVIALGMRSPVRTEDLDAIWAFYAANGQPSFRIDITPHSHPRELASWLTARGMYCNAGTFKIWRPVEPPLAAPPEVEVRRLGTADTDAIAELNLLAWGAWSSPAMRSWFGASVGLEGAHHYGVFDGGDLVATGALFVGDGIGWFGFDATHPRHQGRQLRQAISALRLFDAMASGCEIVHAESAVPLKPRVFRDGWQSLYEKQSYSTTRADEVRE